MSNTQSNHRNKRTVRGQRMPSTTKVALAQLVRATASGAVGSGFESRMQHHSILKVYGSRPKVEQAKSMQGSTLKVSKDVALETAKSWFTSLGCSFPVGLVRLPVVGGLLL